MFSKVFLIGMMGAGKSSVGKKIPAAKDAKERYCNSSYHLYASYCSYCEDTGSKPVG